ncbi:hypothetical protein A0H76_2924 [Hepatospora eriocheir]|uniref:DNA replication complex GINS protein PSF1 n=1 Tax=Hepatospora eriocheir TaxID=1081669 RepID=A0A1X0Q5J3_9MICR|nr:hypothetical protein A0H76_2924 [Hepatospora eriocheir]
MTKLEIENSYKENESNEILINFALLKEYKERNDMIVNAYKFNRLLKIEDRIHTNIDYNCLSNDEISFLKDYKFIMKEYFKKYKFLDIKNRNVSINLYVQILVLEDCGVVYTDNDFIDLKKDHIYYLKKNDINHLLKNDLIKIIKE